MFNSEQLQEKWSPLLNHEGLEDIKDPHRKAVTAESGTSEYNTEKS